MRVIKRAKLRVSSARDSATCGYLDVGTVIDVLERATPVQERVPADELQAFSEAIIRLSSMAEYNIIKF